MKLEISRTKPFRAPAGTACVELSIPTLARLFGGLKAGLSLLAGMVMVAAAMSKLSRPPLAGTEAGVPPGATLGIGVTLLIASIVHIQRSILSKGRLWVLRDRLVIDHPGLFKAPQEIPRSLVSAISIDPRRPGFRSEKDERFHLAGAGRSRRRSGEWPQWLYSGEGGSPFPLLSPVMDTPNIALLFRYPFEMKQTRKDVRAFPIKSPTHIPVHKAKTRGLLARAVVPTAARRALQAWGPVRPLTLDDVLSVHPSAQEEQRANNKLLLSRVVIGLLVAAPALLHLAENASSY